MSAPVNLVIRDATADDHPAAAAVLTGAFGGGDVACWAEPDPDHRALLLRLFFTGLVQHTTAYGTIRLAQAEHTIVAVACWYPYPLPPEAVDVHAIGEQGPQTPAAEAAQRLGRLETALAARHPRHRRHDYLAYLAVTPDRHNQGIGTALIQDHHTTLERTATPAYLEANDPRNHKLYLRLGYTDYGPPITAAGSPPVWPMWHQPTTDRP